MMYYIVKLAVTAALAVAISEIAKHSSFFGAILASIPLVSVLGMSWLYFDTKNTEQVAALSSSIFWLVIPSLPMFLVLPALLRYGMSFYWSLFLCLCMTVCCYFFTVLLLHTFGIRL